jgi:hypothetical protein
MPGSAEMARNRRGDVRIDYSVGGSRRTRVWEPIDVGVLETTFRQDGAVLLQLAVEKKNVERRIKDTLAEAGCDSARETEYRDVVFDRACPWCSKHALVRVAQAYRSRGQVPIVPMYHCTECRGRSYYLSDDYLIHLISSNPHLFEEADNRRFREEREAFVTEVRGNIISIFASKKVRRIE